LRLIARYQSSSLRQNLMRSAEPVCKFEVTCSVYATHVFLNRGFVGGGVLTVLRLLVCTFSPRGVRWPGWLSGT
jgi:putative component of membrane protein insertase Oxa1/YidC/SpoIIIJ protein YidD